MSPEGANVFVAEDEPVWHEIIRKAVESAGHRVVLSANTIPEVLAAVKSFRELGIQVATIDGSLDEANGQTILAAIRTKAPEVKTVGMSGISIKGVDTDVGKSNVKELGKIITEL